MAFAAAGLTAFGHGVGVNRIFHYTTNDLFTAVDDSGYFNAATADLRQGDILLVSSDLDGTILPGILVVTSASGAATVTTTPLASATLNLYQPIRKDVSVPAIGTAETIYVHSGVPANFVGTVTRVTGVTDTAGAGSGGTSTITITVPTTGAIATLPFLQDVAAGALIEDTTITAHAALTSTGVITIATDGTGTHAGAAVVSLELTLAPA
jgi:hypothetical protein